MGTKAPTTVAPTNVPTATPTKMPTATPTTVAPTRMPTATPTKMPTATPTNTPSSAPTTVAPTSVPTANPTSPAPTRNPTALPTGLPTTAQPTKMPTGVPTMPTTKPTAAPTPAPTRFPIDDRLAAYWDYGDCGPHGDNNNWDWCGTWRFSCPATRVVAEELCSSGIAVLMETKTFLRIHGCAYAYYAQYACRLSESIVDNSNSGPSRRLRGMLPASGWFV